MPDFLVSPRTSAFFRSHLSILSVPEFHHPDITYAKARKLEPEIKHNTAFRATFTYHILQMIQVLSEMTDDSDSFQKALDSSSETR